MSEGAVLPSALRGRYRHLLLVALVGIGGLFLLHRQEILSGFKMVIGEPGDDRLNDWTLEHGYRWLRGDHDHADFWSPAYFYPEPNVAAYTESLLGLQPIYAAARLAGLAPETACAVLALTLAALNFAAFYLLARRFFGFSIGAATAGAFLFAFSSPRAVVLNHLQMAAGFIEVAAVAALIAIFERRSAGRAWIALFWGSCVWQLYAGVYHTWIFLLLLALTAAIALAREERRARLWAGLRRDPTAWVTGALVAALAALPWAFHYLAAARRLGGHSLGEVLLLLPRPGSWLNLGPGSLLYGGLSESLLGAQVPYEWVHRLGLGFVTWALVLWGAGLAVRLRIEPLRWMVVAFGLAVLLAMRWPGGWSLWRAVYEVVPGATAIRAVGRLAVVGLLPLALCLALAWQRLEDSRRWRAWLLPLAALVVLEQVQTPETYRRGPVRATVARLAQRIPPDCAVFFYSSDDPGAMPHHVHLEAMWASMATGIPTINGYSGGAPPDWPLQDAVIRAPEGEPALRDALRRWIAARQIREPVCWIRWDGMRDHPAEVERLPGMAAVAGPVTGFTVAGGERR